MPTILIVDDSTMIRMQVNRTLSTGGHEVLQAKDGQEAWEMLQGGLQPDMIISDVNMPRMSGLDLLQAIHESGSHPTLPIVMLTTEGQPSLIRQARSLGAKGWLVKPFKPELLLATISKITKKAA